MGNVHTNSLTGGRIITELLMNQIKVACGTDLDRNASPVMGYGCINFPYWVETHYHPTTDMPTARFALCDEHRRI